jgi:hypothetical protein
MLDPEANTKLSFDTMSIFWTAIWLRANGATRVTTLGAAEARRAKRGKSRRIDRIFAPGSMHSGLAGAEG